MLVTRAKEDYKDKSIKDLVLEQQQIMKLIIKFENDYILEKTEPDIPSDIAIIQDPSLTVEWRVLSRDLIMLTELIDEKTRDENGIGIEF